MQTDPNSKMVCPLKIDMYCNNNTETALHAAIKGKHYDIAFALLKAGASVNTVIKAYHDINEVSHLLTIYQYVYDKNTGNIYRG